jgi:SAM-dependent methyltransferase
VSEVFGAGYASAYDVLYAEKDYDAECDLLEQAFRASARRVRTVLDLGCGTGAHARRLADRGYEVVGVDISPEMLRIARRAEREGDSGSVAYVEGDIRAIRLDREFDAVVCMFAVLGYQTADEDVSRALETARVHLAPGGPFVFDVWYGPAVEAIGPSDRQRLVRGDGVEIERFASARLEPDAHLCTVSYRLVTRRPGLPDEAFDEHHRMRYFFEDELRTSLAAANLELRSLRPFPDTGAPLSTDDWNVVGVAAG